MQTPRRFLDFISCLGWFVPEEDERAAARLLGEEPPDAGDRVSLYVCAECGDLECGAITAVIEQQGSAVVWAAPALTTRDHEPGAWHHDEQACADWPELRFDAREYRSAITSRPRA